MDSADIPFCRNGGLTLLPLPGSEAVVAAIKREIEDYDPKVHKRTPVDIVDPCFGTYSNDETSFSTPNTHINEHDVYIVGSGPMNDDMLMKLLWAISLVGGRHAGRVTIVTPYFPHSRSDKDEGADVLSALNILVNIVKTTAAAANVNLWRWICFDPHSIQITTTGRTGMITPIFMTRKLLRFAINKARQLNDELPLVLCFPDASAHARYKTAIRAVKKEFNLELPIVKAEKVRRRDDTEIVDISGDTDAVRGARLLMFDDEIATGGTSIDMARAMKREFHAASIFACATHPVLSGPATSRLAKMEELYGGTWIDHLIFTDSIPITGRPNVQALIESGRMSVYSIRSTLARIIYLHHWGENIRTLS